MPRLVTPVRTQPAGDLRCITFAVAAAMETAICRDRQTVIGVPEISVDDLFIQGGREVGAIDGLQFALKRSGAVDATCFPAGAAGRCSNPAPHLWKADIRLVGGNRGERVNQMRNDLRTRGPLVATLQAFVNFTGFVGPGVYQAQGKTAGFHSLCIIGDEVDGAGTSGFWIAKNSFGPAWGDGGFVRFRWNDPDLKLESMPFVVEDVRQ